MARKRHDWTARVKLDMQVGYDTEAGASLLYNKTLQELMDMIEARGRANTKGSYNMGVENTAAGDRILREAWQERLATAKRKGRHKVRVRIPVTVNVHTYFTAELRPRDLRKASKMARDWASREFPGAGRRLPDAAPGKSSASTLSSWHTVTTDRPFILPT